MRILVTGGSGFIGSHFVKHCLSLGDTILNVDKLSYASNISLEEVKSPDYYFYKENIANSARMEDLIKNFEPEFVVNLAAESHVDNSINSSFQFIHSNFVGTYSLLEAVRKINPKILFLHVSTDEVFGSIKTGCFLDEAIYNPGSPYSATKAGSDHLVRAWGNTYNIPFIITHSVNNYGPWQHVEKFIPTVIKKASQGKPIPIYGTGKNVRNWIYVVDHVRALRILLERGKIGESYNISTMYEKSNIDVVMDICTLLDEFQPEFQHSQFISYVEDRKGHDFRYAVNSLKIGQIWEPLTRWKEGLRETVKWYLQN